MRFNKTTALTGVFALTASLLTFTAVNTNSMSQAVAADINGAWSSVGTGGPSGNVFSMIQDGSTIYAVGQFTSPATYIAKYDGSAWTSVTNQAFTGNGMYTLAKDATGTIYAGGNFSATGVTGGNHVVAIDTSTTTANVRALGAGVNRSGSQAGVERIAISGSKVYVGGGFSNVINSPSSAVSNTAGLANWDATTGWTPLGTGLDAATASNKSVNGFHVDSSGDVYIGGYFDGASWSGGSVTSQRIVKYNSSANTFSALGTGVKEGTYSTVTSILERTTGTNSGLWIGGGFAKTNDATATVLNGLAKWDASTTTWNAIGSGSSAGVTTNAVIESMAFDTTGNLYIGGGFTTVNGIPANRIAKFDGTTWSAITCGTNNGVNGAVRAILPQTDGSLIIGGQFQNAGGNPQADYVARYTPGADNCPSAGGGGGGPAAGTPSAPQNVKAQWNPTDGDGSITVTWDAPATDNGSPIVQYVASTADGRAECYTGVAYTCKIRVQDVRIPFRKPVSSGNATQPENFWANINNSQAAKEYLVRNVFYTDQVTVAWANGIYVQARNGVGWGAQGFVPQRDPNAPVVPPSAPLNPKAVAGWKEITVSWEPPTNSGTFPVTNYLVQATPGGSVCVTRLTDANYLECKFSNLTPGVNYTFKVQALNGGGWGDFSVATNSASPLDLLTDTIDREQNKILFIKAGSTLTVDGRAPGYAPGTVITPQLKIGENGSWVSETRDLPKVPAGGPNKRFTWTKKLNKSLDKKPVEVRFVIGSNTSNSMKANIGTSLGLPSAPRDVKVSSSTAGIKVEWKAPAKNGGSPITRYVVSSNLGKFSCEILAPATSCTQRQWGSISHSPNKTYTFEVVAKTARGTGREAKAQWRGELYSLNIFSREIFEDEIILRFKAAGFSCTQKFEVEAKIESDGKWTKQRRAATMDNCDFGDWIGPLPKVDGWVNVYYRLKSPNGYSNERRIIVRN